MISSNAKFDEQGQAAIIRDLERHELLLAGGNLTDMTAGGGLGATQNTSETNFVTQDQLASVISGYTYFNSNQLFTSNGTFDILPSYKCVCFLLVGGGGGSAYGLPSTLVYVSMTNGGPNTTTLGVSGSSSGAGSGELAFLFAPITSVTVTASFIIGTGGAGGTAGNNGNNGNGTSITINGITHAVAGGGRSLYGGGVTEGRGGNSVYSAWGNALHYPGRDGTRAVLGDIGLGGAGPFGYGSYGSGANGASGGSNGSAGKDGCVMVFYQQ